MARSRRWIDRLAVWLASALVVPLAAEGGFECAGYAAVAPAPAGAAGKAAASRQPTTGNLQVLVVFAGFPEDVATRPVPPPYAAALLDPERPGSFAHFYRSRPPRRWS